jgi:hypothetical protein
MRALDRSSVRCRRAVLLRMQVRRMSAPKTHTQWKGRGANYACKHPRLHASGNMHARHSERMRVPPPSRKSSIKHAWIRSPGTSVPCTTAFFIASPSLVVVRATGQPRMVRAPTRSRPVFRPSAQPTSALWKLTTEVVVRAALGGGGAGSPWLDDRVRAAPVDVGKPGGVRGEKGKRWCGQRDT